MRIISFNANGLRSAFSKGFGPWFSAQAADVLCLQETRVHPEQRQGPDFYPPNWHCVYHDAQKKGYSGVAIWSRWQPDEIRTALNLTQFDEEGRYIEARFGNLSVVSLYLPSGSASELRQDFKFQILKQLHPILTQWLNSGRDYVLCGDWNIVRSALDIKNWKANQSRSGCLPAERDWLNHLCADAPEQRDLSRGRGWIDSYRRLHPQGQDYTWWSQRGRARANNVGWRIDYQFVTPELAQCLQSCTIYREPYFSDHAPFSVDYGDYCP